MSKPDKSHVCIYCGKLIIDRTPAEHGPDCPAREARRGSM